MMSSESLDRTPLQRKNSDAALRFKCVHEMPTLLRQNIVWNSGNVWGYRCPE
ncbi:MAG TPA: hypothetical protein VHM70_02785 [Polyangiaceae bacterium]|jgi:hypothetical protein|nr:hypothetical protein [Polyangiaceae bacterium]